MEGPLRPVLHGAAPHGYRTDMSEDQLQPADSLDDRGVDDVLDEGFSPPEKLRGSTAKGVTAAEAEEGETIDERIAQEEPEVWAEVEAERDADILDGPVGGEVGAARTGRLGEGENGDSMTGDDVGIDGGAASAEEAAVHTIEDPLET